MRARAAAPAWCAQPMRLRPLPSVGACMALCVSGSGVLDSSHVSPLDCKQYGPRQRGLGASVTAGPHLAGTATRNCPWRHPRANSCGATNPAMAPKGQQTPQLCVNECGLNPFFTLCLQIAYLAAV